MIATIRSSSGGIYPASARDVVRANTVCFNYRPDLRYDTSAGGSYTSGQSVYAPPPQGYSQYADNNTTITYFIRVENDGSSDTFSLTASGPAANWTISYYDNNNVDRTVAMRNGTHSTGVITSTGYRDYRVEVTGNSVISGSSSAAYFYSYSTTNLNFYDAMITTIPGIQADALGQTRSGCELYGIILPARRDQQTI